MNNFQNILNNQWFQILVLVLLFWFLFLRENFNDIPNDEETCEKCNKKIFNEKENLSITEFKNKCSKLNGQYKKENNIISCLNYKAKLDSNYRCNCDIQ